MPARVVLAYGKLSSRSHVFTDNGPVLSHFPRFLLSRSLGRVILKSSRRVAPSVRFVGDVRLCKALRSVLISLGFSFQPNVTRSLSVEQLRYELYLWNTQESWKLDAEETNPPNITVTNRNPLCMNVCKTPVFFFPQETVPISWLTYIRNKIALKPNAEHADRKQTPIKRRTCTHKAM